MDMDPTSEDTGGAHEGGGCAHPPGAPPASWGPRSSSDVPPAPIYTLKLLEQKIDREFRRCKPL